MNVGSKFLFALFFFPSFFPDVTRPKKFSFVKQFCCLETSMMKSKIGALQSRSSTLLPSAPVFRANTENVETK